VLQRDESNALTVLDIGRAERDPVSPDDLIGIVKIYRACIASLAVSTHPASFAFHAVQSAPDVVARTIVQPEILDEWSIVWPARGQSAAIERVLDTARRCAAENGWLPA
jgi:hypothetical protein